MDFSNPENTNTSSYEHLNNPTQENLETMDNTHKGLEELKGTVNTGIFQNKLVEHGKIKQGWAQVFELLKTQLFAGNEADVDAFFRGEYPEMSLEGKTLISLKNEATRIMKEQEILLSAMGEENTSMGAESFDKKMKDAEGWNNIDTMGASISGVSLMRNKAEGEIVLGEETGLEDARKKIQSDPSQVLREFVRNKGRLSSIITELQTHITQASPALKEEIQKNAQRTAKEYEATNTQLERHPLKRDITFQNIAQENNHVLSYEVEIPLAHAVNTLDKKTLLPQIQSIIKDEIFASPTAQNELMQQLYNLSTSATEDQLILTMDRAQNHLLVRIEKKKPTEETSSKEVPSQTPENSSSSPVAEENQRTEKISSGITEMRPEGSLTFVQDAHMDKVPSGVPVTQVSTITGLYVKGVTPGEVTARPELLREYEFIDASGVVVGTDGVREWKLNKEGKIIGFISSEGREARIKLYPGAKTYSIDLDIHSIESYRALPKNISSQALDTWIFGGTSEEGKYSFSSSYLIVPGENGPKGCKIIVQAHPKPGYIPKISEGAHEGGSQPVTNSSTATAENPTQNSTPGASPETVHAVTEADKKIAGNVMDLFPTIREKKDVLTISGVLVESGRVQLTFGNPTLSFKEKEFDLHPEEQVKFLATLTEDEKTLLGIKDGDILSVKTSGKNMTLLKKAVAEKEEDQNNNPTKDEGKDAKYNSTTKEEKKTNEDTKKETKNEIETLSEENKKFLGALKFVGIGVPEKFYDKNITLYSKYNICELPVENMSDGEISYDKISEIKTDFPSALKNIYGNKDIKMVIRNNVLRISPVGNEENEKLLESLGAVYDAFFVDNPQNSEDKAPIPTEVKKGIDYSTFIVETNKDLGVHLKIPFTKEVIPVFISQARRKYIFDTLGPWKEKLGAKYYEQLVIRPLSGSKDKPTKGYYITVDKKISEDKTESAKKNIDYIISTFQKQKDGLLKNDANFSLILGKKIAGTYDMVKNMKDGVNKEKFIEVLKKIASALLPVLQHWSSEEALEKGVLDEVIASMQEIVVHGVPPVSTPEKTQKSLWQKSKDLVSSWSPW